MRGLLAPYETEFSKALDKRSVLRAVVADAFAGRDISVLEIGVGRSPLFDPVPVGWRYVANDISAGSLARLSPPYETLCADICGDVSAFAQQFDVVFSCHLAEHLPDGEAFYRNQFALLKPGGAFVHVHPVLYALPFVANRLLPVRFGRAAVETLRPHRKVQRSVFPAHYRWCTALERDVKRRSDLGFRHVERIVGYHHAYFRRVPLVRDVDEVLCSAFEILGLRVMAAYCMWFGIK